MVLPMDEKLKKRLIGASVLATLAVIFVPMLFEEPPPEVPTLPPLPEPPPRPDLATDLLSDEVPKVIPLAPRAPLQEPPAAVPPSVAEDPPPRRPTAPVNAPQPPADLTGWVVQVGSFSNIDNARRLVERLRAADLPTPDADPVVVDRQRLYRVMVGPLLERSEAERLQARVDRIAGVESKVWRYPQ
jgi:DedD protein